MAATVDLSRMRAALESRYKLRDFRPVCPGMARATQQLGVGDEVICTDEVLVEEVTYRIPDEMAVETSSMTLKMGMLSPFTRYSTYPPKYYHVDEASATAWFITSVPQVSLAMVLDELRHRYPAHYTWNRIAYVRDILRALRAALREAWAARRAPGRALSVLAETLEERLPRRITPAERLQFAAALVDAVRPRHAAGIYHNNISPHTIFFTDGASPRLLCNYGGMVPPVMDGYIPDAIRHRHRDDTFGEQSMDTYALALLAYEIITGKSLSGPQFSLDEYRAITAPLWLQRRRTGWLAFVNVGLDLAQEGWLALARLVDGVSALFDTARHARFRMLARASGSIVRGLPFVRNVLDLWFPTEIAFALRVVLDKTYNERLCGPRSRLNRSSRRKRNVNTAYLRAALPAQTLRRDSRLAQLIQQVIDRATERVDHAEEERAPYRRLELRFGRPYLLRYALTTAMLVLVCIGTANHQARNPLQSPSSRPAASEPLAMGLPSPAWPPPASGTLAPAQPPGQPAAAPEPLPVARPGQKPLRKEIKRRLMQPAVPVGAPPPVAAPAQPARGCRAFLAPNKKYRDVYRVTDLGPECGLGDITIHTPPDHEAPFATLGDAYVRFYVTRRAANGYGPIIAVQQCRSENADECDMGKLYQVVRIGELGDEVVLSDGDVVGFSKLHLITFRNSVR
jgi:hypothetical protein